MGKVNIVTIPQIYNRTIVSLFSAGMIFWSLKKYFNIYLAPAARVALDDYCSRRLRSQSGVSCSGIAAGAPAC